MPVSRLDASCPRAFVCPLTGKPFQEPLLAADGWTYEAQALATWQQRHGARSPKTRAVMSAPAVPNRVLARALREYQEQAGGEAPPLVQDEWFRNVDCPISMEPMRYPVRLSDGHDYDLDQAKILVRVRRRSPLTEEPFDAVERVRPDRAMQQLMRDVQVRRCETPALGSTQATESSAYPVTDLQVPSFYLRPEPIGGAAPELAAATDAFIDALLEGASADRLSQLAEGLRGHPWVSYRLQERMAETADTIIDLGHALLHRETRLGGWPHLLERSVPWLRPHRTRSFDLWSDMNAAGLEFAGLHGLWALPQRSDNAAFLLESSAFLAARAEHYGTTPVQLRSVWAYSMTAIGMNYLTSHSLFIAEHLGIYGLLTVPVALGTLPLAVKAYLEVTNAVQSGHVGTVQQFVGMQGAPTLISTVAAMPRVVTRGLAYAGDMLVGATVFACWATAARFYAGMLAPQFMHDRGAQWPEVAACVGAVVGCGINYLAGYSMTSG